MKYASWWMDQVGFVGIERKLASPLCLPSLPDCGAVYLPDCGASPGTQSALCRTGRALARDSLRHVDHGSCVRMRMAWRRPRLVNDRPPFHQRPREECGDQRGKMRLAVHRRLRRLLRPRLPLAAAALAAATEPAATVTPAPVAATSLTATAQPAAAISPTALTATLPAQPPGDATAASGRESLSSAGWGRRRHSAGGGRAAGWPAARLDSNYGPPLGRAARGPCGARRGRRARRAGGGEASQSGRWLAEGVGRVRGGTQAAGTGRGGPCGVREGPFVRPGSHPAGGHRGRNWQRLGLCVGWSRWGIWCLFMVLISPTHHSQPAGPHGAILKASAIAQVPNHVLVRAGRARSPPPRVRCSD